MLIARTVCDLSIELAKFLRLSSHYTGLGLDSIYGLEARNLGSSCTKKGMTISKSGSHLFLLGASLDT